MHTQWCTYVTVTNSDMQTREKQKPLAKIRIDKICNNIIGKRMTKPAWPSLRLKPTTSPKTYVGDYGESTVEITE